MSINAKCSLQGIVTARQTLVGSVNVGGTVLPDQYEGEYEITPKVTAQTLETKEKYMLEDVQVKEIPCFDTSNTSGGTTVYIGGSIELI